MNVLTMWDLMRTADTELVDGAAGLAVFSADRLYRYALSRTWDASAGLLVVIGLNPSTADESTDDPTITRCRTRAMNMGFGGMVLAGWGAHGSYRGRSAAVVAQLLAENVTLHALRTTNAGEPGHPLYISYARQPFLWKQP